MQAVLTNHPEGVVDFFGQPNTGGVPSFHYWNDSWSVVNVAAHHATTLNDVFKCLGGDIADVHRWRIHVQLPSYIPYPADNTLERLLFQAKLPQGTSLLVLSTFEYLCELCHNRAYCSAWNSTPNISSGTSPFVRPSTLWCVCVFGSVHRVRIYSISVKLCILVFNQERMAPHPVVRVMLKCIRFLSESEYPVHFIFWGWGV